MDFDQSSDDAAGMHSGRAGKEGSEVDETSFQYGCVVTLGLTSVRYAVLVWKLGLLLKLMDDEVDGVGTRVFHYLLDDVSSM